jgi:hypothetical protein
MLRFDMRTRSLLTRTLLAALALSVIRPATAQMLTSFFQEGVPGYGTQDGVTVQSRLHPDQMPLGLRAGDFRFWPSLSEGFGYNSNVLAGSPARGSWQIVTEPSLTIASDWSRDAFGAAASLQSIQYLSLPGQDRTNASLSTGGRVDIGQDQLTMGIAHLSGHEDRGQIDTLPSDQPIAFQLDDARASYAWTDGRWSLTPTAQLSNWTYDSTTILGAPASQSYRDRLVAQGSVTLRYERAPLRNLLFVVRALNQDYTRTPAGQPTPDSTAFQALAGFDYDDNAVWRWRLLVGGESRQFASSLYAQQNTLIAEAGVTWFPSGDTSVGAMLSRETADAAQQGVSGLTYTAARLSIDHEILRNLLVNASIGLQRVAFFQGGSQVAGTGGIGLVWVMDRSMRVAFTYNESRLQASQGQPVENYTGGVGLITFRIGL